jgi:hypothetical protein
VPNEVGIESVLEQVGIPVSIAYGTYRGRTVPELFVRMRGFMMTRGTSEIGDARSQTRGWSARIYLSSIDARIEVTFAIEKILRVQAEFVDPAPITDRAIGDTNWVLRRRTPMFRAGAR